MISVHHHTVFFSSFFPPFSSPLNVFIYCICKPYLLPLYVFVLCLFRFCLVFFFLFFCCSITFTSHELKNVLVTTINLIVSYYLWLSGCQYKFKWQASGARVQPDYWYLNVLSCILLHLLFYNMKSGPFYIMSKRHSSSYELSY